jgi:hypothetical protein
LIVIFAPIIASVLGAILYGYSTDWYFMRPGLPAFEKFQANPESANPLADAVGVPRPPAAKEFTTEQARQLYEQYGLLRRNPEDSAALEQLAAVFDDLGMRDAARSCLARLNEIGTSRN